MLNLKNLLTIILGATLLTACGGGGGSSNETTPESIPLTINVNNFDSNVRSYEPKTITVTANYSCSFNLSGFHIELLLLCLKKSNSI